MSITQKQSEVLGAIKEYIEANNISPTIREIVEITNIKSTSTIHKYIKALESKGYISMRESKSRTIKIISKQ